MRIGIDLRLHAYAPGGISRYGIQLSRALVNLVDPGGLTVILSRRAQQDSEVPGARIRTAWTPPHHRLEKWSLGAELLPLKLDVLHSTDFIPPAWGARRNVITVHDLNFLIYPQYLTADARRYYNGQIAWAVKRAAAIIADSFATRSDLEHLLGVASARVTVTHLAADPRIQPLPPELVAPVMARCGLEPGYILFVGTWEPRKNLPGLLEALAQMHARSERRHLVIAGRPGWLYDEIYARIEALRLTPWVHLIEQPDLATLAALYNGAALLVLPSFYEGFGLTALEAMQCGTPVVVSDRASLPEIVGEAGLLVNPEDPAAIADACLMILQDGALRERLSQAGQDRARLFTWEATARKTLEVYNTVLMH